MTVAITALFLCAMLLISSTVLRRLLGTLRDVGEFYALTGAGECLLMLTAWLADAFVLAGVTWFASCVTWWCWDDDRRGAAGGEWW